jgi:hypothetical protein
MSTALQIVLCLSVLTLTVFLVLLLVQARRTALAVERLAEGAARDLRQVAEDVHEVRNQVDEVAKVARTAFELPSATTQVVAGIVRALPALFGRRKGASNWIETLLTGIQTALHLLGRPRASHSKEATNE